MLLSTAAWVDLRSNQNNIWSAALVDGAGSWSANTRVTDNTATLKVVFAPGLLDHVDLAYDGLNRLRSVGGALSETFALDQASNIDSRTGPEQDYSYREAIATPRSRIVAQSVRAVRLTTG